LNGTRGRTTGKKKNDVWKNRQKFANEGPRGPPGKRWKNERSFQKEYEKEKKHFGNNEKESD